MSLHEDPKTPAERFALHLETFYGVQLDAYRRQALVTELENFAGAAHAAQVIPEASSRRRRAKPPKQENT